MKAVVLREGSFGVEELPEPICDSGSALVRVLCAALNHRDQYIREGKYSKIQLPAILGSDICGISDFSSSRVLDFSSSRVLVDPSMMWGDDPRAQGPEYNPIGMPSQGGLAEYVCVPKENIYPAPSHLTNEQCAALPLAGVTAWRALFTRGALQPGETVLITGIGGGVALTAMQFALAHGARVLVMSRSEEKIAKAMQLGASEGFHVPTAEFQVPGAMFQGDLKKTLKEKNIDMILDSVGGDTFNDLTDVLHRGGRLVVYGSSRGVASSVNLHRVFWKQLSVIGSTMGVPQDFTAMLAFVNKHKLVPVVDSVYELADTPQAFDHMKDNRQFGKIVIRVTSDE